MTPADRPKRQKVAGRDFLPGNTYGKQAAIARKRNADRRAAQREAMELELEASLKFRRGLNRVLGQGIDTFNKNVHKPETMYEAIAAQLATDVLKTKSAFTFRILHNLWVGDRDRIFEAPLPHPDAERQVKNVPRFIDIINDIMQHPGLADEKKYRLVAQITAQYHRIQNAKANSYNVDEMQTLIDSAMDIAEQTIGDQPELYTQFSDRFADVLQEQYRNRIMVADEKPVEAPKPKRAAKRKKQGKK